MPFPGASRSYLTAALLHLAVAGILILDNGRTRVLSGDWDVLVWLLLIGFVGCTTLGFALHLFPPIARRSMAHGIAEKLAFPLTEAAVVVGALAEYEQVARPGFGWLFSIGASLFLASVALVVSEFVGSLLQPRIRGGGPEVRPGDTVSVPLFLASWTAALGSGAIFLLSGLARGPGFGWWIAAVHLFVLGHATLLVAAVGLRLVPRSVGADPPAVLATALAGLGALGAVLVPLGMLVVPLTDPVALVALAAPEAAFAVLFFGLLLYLGAHARIVRPQLALELTSALCIMVGGGLGLWMVAESNYTWVVTHAIVNVLGFLGVMIVVMWFGMIAPFQRISHAWTRRMLWTLSTAWLVGVVLLAGSGGPTGLASGSIAWIGGGLLLAVAVTWALGTLPVLFPRLDPIPGVSPDRLHLLRDRWGRR